jgi:ATP-dependent Clp protease ATP-binding subunit ClpC
MRSERLLVRLDVGTKRVLQQLADRQGTSLSDTVRLAIRETGWRRGLTGDEGDKFTLRARRVFQLASDEATERRAPAIEPIHLLLGLLRVTDGRAVLMLRSLGIDVERAYEVADDLAGRQAGTPTGLRGLSEPARRAIELTVAEANRLEHHYVGTEHLLLGLLAEQEDGGATRALAEIGVGAERIRATIDLYREKLVRIDL